jgi:hypothetical protein
MNGWLSGWYKDIRMEMDNEQRQIEMAGNGRMDRPSTVQFFRHGRRTAREGK